MENERVEPPPPGRVVSWIRRFPVLSFFVLTYAITFGSYCLHEGARKGDIELPQWWVLAWVAAFGPALAGVWVTGATDGVAGIRRLLAGLVVWRVGVRWWLVAVVLCPATLLTAIALGSVIGGTPLEFGDPTEWDAQAIIEGIALLVVGAAGEEIGWRGCALPRLQARKGPFLASVYLAFVWGPWHLAGGRFPYSTPDRLMAAALSTLSTTLISILLTWTYNGTRRSLLLASVMHASFNLSLLYVGYVVSTGSGLVAPLRLLLELAIVIVVIVRLGWLRRSPEAASLVEPERVSPSGEAPTS